ncbi:class I SAM-dependent DNA methyltransferase [Anabaenopsis elenkinii]|uniref:site-specific DNA-methyltransferase (adenine-specific) n=1 Tax=Anabaenopsis elenkinii CCIBt3563 TaxID=2779889 RepID=A0A7S6RGH4_9CYAN|nr:TaqI-like C-terminal specificity domain-containing protein [Anabaenopsis elenkinii]QOV24393.1 Eco57I restriction-modification methylase domain-containing protein [Anabaenopsis elenkinii CCIBt3563]
MTKILPRQALNKAFLKVKPYRNQIELFKTHLTTLIQQINEGESEEFHKNLIADFLKNTYYGSHHFINTKGRNDLVIHNGKDAHSTVGVILETKKPTNKAEMLTVENLNTKALQELVLYFLRERLSNKNLEIKYLIATNIYEWFIFDATVFEKSFVENPQFIQQYHDFEDGRLTSKKTEFFYKEIAQPAIANLQTSLVFTHFDLREYAEIVKNPQPTDDHRLIALFKLLSPEHLLKLPFANDSNTLDQGFYSELLHIIGLTETKEGGKKLIQRQKPGSRNPGSLIENAISQLDSLDKISRIEKPEQFGLTEQDRLFNVALELAITWINRILFLKLLEAQLIRYHKHDTSFGFLNLDKVKNYDDLNSLFFSVLARQPGERIPSLQKIFTHVPYLNSSLFEPTDIEQITIFISNLTDEHLTIFDATVLKDSNGKKRTGSLRTLEYLLEFLNAYDFSSEGSEDIQEENKRLINASVLGLIFEKINGYQDGSFFTPGFITMYMCRETIRRAVVQKFNQVKGWNCQDIDQLYEEIRDKQEANQIINSLKICDPAVGSGHFLVSALNEVIAVKSELKILLDRQGKTLRDYQVEVVNDELVVTDDDGLLFEYNPQSKESQRVQEALFHEKQRIIEGCLFGVDVNPNSVKICRLRLWIELLKNAYYLADGNYSQLETLPNIDINIKCGNSLISRFALDGDLRPALKKKYTIDGYRHAVQTYRHAENKQQKREMERLVDDIKGNLKNTLQGIDPRKQKLRGLEGELYNLENQVLLFEETKGVKKMREKKIVKLNHHISQLRAEIEEIESGRIYENSLEWRFEFPEVLDDQGVFLGFDVVIGNPPYIRQEEIKELKRTLRQNYECYVGTADLFVYFYELGLRLLKPLGHLSYISSNKYFRAGYGERLRGLLTQKTTIYNLIDFGDFPVFEEAIAYPSIIALGKLQSQGNQVRALYWDRAIEENIVQFPRVLDEEGLIIPQENLKPDGWRVESSQVLELLGKLRNIGQPLGEYVKGRFYRGIVTGFNQAFVVDRVTRDRLIDEHPSSAEVLKPFLRGRDVKRWCVNSADFYLLFIPWHFPLHHDLSITGASQTAEREFKKQYPAIYKHLLQFKTQLSGRNKAETGIRYEWYALQRCAASYWKEFEQPKIIWGNLATKPQFAIAKQGFYLSAPANLVISPENEYILAILNSKITEFYIKQIAATRQGGFIEFKPMYVSQIPIPTATKTQQKLLEQIVEQILTVKQADPQADTTPLEAKINQVVYQLYNLTAEEIQIIKSQIG